MAQEKKISLKPDFGKLLTVFKHQAEVAAKDIVRDKVDITPEQVKEFVAYLNIAMHSVSSAKEFADFRNWFDTNIHGVFQSEVKSAAA
jgi:hypothetical protein